MVIIFRRCELKDLHVLIEIGKSTFISAFEKDNNPDDFEAYLISAFSEKQFKSELLNPNSAFYFAYLDDTLVGYFKLNEGEAQSEQFETSSIELERIYVLNAFQNQGIGKQLLNKSIAIAQLKEVSFLWLGVWEKNAAAIRFYERYNFVKFDKHAYYIGNDKQQDWLLKLVVS